MTPREEMCWITRLIGWGAISNPSTHKKRANEWPEEDLPRILEVLRKRFMESFYRGQEYSIELLEKEIQILKSPRRFNNDISSNGRRVTRKGEIYGG